MEFKIRLQIEFDTFSLRYSELITYLQRFLDSEMKATKKPERTLFIIQIWEHISGDDENRKKAKFIIEMSNNDLIENKI